MKRFFRFFSFAPALLVVVVLCSCSSRGNKVEASSYEQLIGSDSIPQNVKDMISAVNANDAEKFADMVGYPLERPYPLKDINTKEEMIAYYNVIMDDSLRNAILGSRPADWDRFGWRGYSFGDGEYLWIDAKIYAINYVSKREQQVMDSLSNVEKKSLPHQLREGWQPELTLMSSDKGTVYRIDRLVAGQKDDNEKYRVSVYDNSNDHASLQKMPRQILDAEKRIEGSANVVSYVFSDNTGKEFALYPYSPDGANPAIAHPDGSLHDLSKAYWHELIR